MRFPAFGLAYLLLYAAGASLLGGQPLARAVLGSVAIILPALAMCAAVLHRRREWRGCQRLFWDSVAIGVGLWIVGYAGWASESIALSSSGSLRWYTLVSLCGGIAPLIALIARPHLGVRSEAVTGVSILMASYALLAVFVYADFLLVPSLVLPEAETQSVLVVLVQVNRAALAAGFLWVAWIGRRSPWRRVYLLLASGVTIGFLLRSITSRGIFEGRYDSGLFVDMAWIAPFLCYAWAACAAPPSAKGAAGAAESVRPLRPFWAAVPVLLIPLVGYLAWWLQPLGGNGDAFRALLTALLTVAGLGFLILRLSLQAGELQRSDARLRLLAAATEQTQDLILITTGDGRVEHANDAFVRALGYSREALARCSYADLLEQGFDRVDVQIRRDLRLQGVWRGTLFRRRRDGSTFPVSCTITALRVNGAITHLVGVERDITAELRLQDQLVHTERLSAIGELVAGVAHEINNPLQTVVGSVELMLEDNPAPATRRDLETVRREAGRAAQIVRSLLAFVRRGTPERVTVDLNQIVHEVTGLRAFSFQQKAIQLSIAPSAEPVLVLGCREELQQIVMNLLLNAEQAVGDSGGGAVSVRTRVIGSRAAVEVEDNGPGVDEVLRGRIFEPFFTTKPVGEGTGLGLSISHGIASAHGGSLELLPVARGATFRLSVPLHYVSSTTAEAPSTLAPRPAVAEESLPFALVVDDEPAIRELLAKLLRKRSFDVMEAESGDEAMGILSARDAALVLCDIRMPGMTGPELFDRVASLPGAEATRFIFMTGDRDAAEHGVGGAEVLAKPFSGGDLDRALAALSVSRWR